MLLFAPLRVKRERLHKQNEERAQARQQIRENFLTYLRSGFPYQMHWQHPLTGKVYSYEEIERGVQSFRRFYPEQYRVLWAIWMSPDRWRVVCEAYGIPHNRQQRYLECAVDHIMLLLCHPDLLANELYDQGNRG